MIFLTPGAFLLKFAVLDHHLCPKATEYTLWSFRQPKRHQEQTNNYRQGKLLVAKQPKKY